MRVTSLEKFEKTLVTSRPLVLASAEEKGILVFLKLSDEAFNNCYAVGYVYCAVEGTRGVHCLNYT